MKNIFIHIGYNKTGSSSIQRHFYKHRRDYLSRGLCYPEHGVFDRAHYGLSKYAVALPDHDKIHAAESLIDEIASEIKSADCDTVLLSSEYFSVAQPVKVRGIFDTVRRLAPDHRPQVIIYLRRHDLWFESLFNQAEKTNPNPDWEMDIRDFVLNTLGSSAPQCSYLRVVNRWAAVFGEKNIIVRPFEREQFQGGDLVTDFVRILGQDDAISDQDVGAVNESLPPGLLYSVGLVKRYLASPIAEEVVSSLLRKRIFNEAIAVPDYGKFKPQHRKSIYQFFLPEYREIARRFLGQKNGRLFLEVPD